MVDDDNKSAGDDLINKVIRSVGSLLNTNTLDFSGANAEDLASASSRTQPELWKRFLEISTTGGMPAALAGPMRGIINGIQSLFNSDPARNTKIRDGGWVVRSPIPVLTRQGVDKFQYELTELISAATPAERTMVFAIQIAAMMNGAREPLNLIIDPLLAPYVATAQVRLAVHANDEERRGGESAATRRNQANRERSALARLKVIEESIERAIENIETRRGEIEAIKGKIGEVEVKAGDVLGSFDVLRKEIDERLKTDATYEHWRGRRNEARTWYIASFGVMTLIAIVAAVAAYEYYGAVFTSFRSFGETFRLPDGDFASTGFMAEFFLRATLIGLPVALGVWVLRMVVRFNSRALHNWHDADHRLSLLETYLHLIASGAAEPSEDRKIALEALFRPTTHSDGGAPDIADLIKITNIAGDKKP